MNEIIIYQNPDNQTQVEVQFEGETFWLSQKQISELFGTEVPAINKHIKNILKEGELAAEATISKMEIVQTEGSRKVSRKVDFYNLDMIISVGYRVNSAQATHFRIWATQRLKEYLVLGYTINQKRLEELGKMVQLIEKSGQAGKPGLNSFTLLFYNCCINPAMRRASASGLSVKAAIIFWRSFSVLFWLSFFFPSKRVTVISNATMPFSRPFL